MPASRVQLRIEVETEGAEQLTTLREELDRLGKAGAGTFTQLDRSLTTVLDKLKLSRNVVAASTRSFLDSQRQLFARLTPLFDSFFRNVLTGSRSLRDALKRLWRDFLDFFLGLVRRMVSAWMASLQVMSGARRLPLSGTGMGGGLLGGLLGAIFGQPAAAGLPGLGGPIGTPPTFPGLGGLLPSLGLGLVLGPGGRMPTMGGITAGVLGSLSGVAGLLGTLGLGLLSGGGVVRGALGGFLTGGALGTLVGGTGALAGTALGAFAGPIGAVVGAIIGAIAKLFQRGKLKRKASQVADQGFAAMRRITEEFERFRVDYESALAQVTAIWQQMVQAWSQMGSIGRRSIRGQQPSFESVIRRINDLQRAREQRTQLISSLQIPEFQFGGIVGASNAHPAGRDRILALVHEGEAVLNRRAVQALGERRIGELNRGLSERGDQFFISIHALDGESVERWLARNEVRLVRFFRRAARDRGLRAPV